MASGTIILSSLFIWLILIGVTVLVFFVVFTLLLQYRKNSLKKVEESIMESKLKISPSEFGKMNDVITELWNTRADVSPIPELNHLARGWSVNQKGEFFSIRDEILKSFNDLEIKACKFNPTYVRKSSVTVQNYLFWLSKQNGIKFDEETIANYLIFYNTARYDRPDSFFNDEDFAIFSQHYHALYDGIPDAVQSFTRRASVFLPTNK